MKEDLMLIDVITYRGQKIDVAKTRNWIMSIKDAKTNKPWYDTPEKVEQRLKKEVLSDKRMIGRLVGAKYEKNGGFRLAFYQKEHIAFSEAYNIKVSDEEARKIVKKLLKHFANSEKAKAWYVRFYGNRGNGSCGWNIRLSHNPSIGLICHEAAHTFVHGHNKKLMKLIAKFTKYCKRMNYWRKEK
jgi:hypothetical protein